MSVVVWNMRRDARRRSDARVALLAGLIHGDQPAAFPETRQHVAPAAFGELFTSRPPARSNRSRVAVALAAGLAVVAIAVSLVATLSVASRRARESAPPAPATAAGDPAESHLAPPTGPPQPLELTALTHERDGDKLIVRGIVRNAGSRTAADELIAMVFLFTYEGSFLGSGRAPISPAALAQATETPFAVTIPGADKVGRYRVSFRSGQRVVPHVDRRNPGAEAPMAKLQ
jgi:hypothetical protein